MLFVIQVVLGMALMLWDSVKPTDKFIYKRTDHVV
jgi:hypothetical protein